ncbi:MAG: fibronectin type III domain-containing protein, partial [Pyrinomonadaceae bacterium]
MAQVNYARPAQGATAIGTSTNGAGYPVAAAFDGVRNTANNWGAGGAWLSQNTMSIANPEGLTVGFGQTRYINQINLFLLADAVNYTTDPTLSDTGSSYLITAFKIQSSNDSGATWQDVVSVTGNNHVWYQYNPPAAIACTGMRVLGTAISGDFARIVEFECWGDSAAQSGGGGGDTTAPSVPGTPTFASIAANSYTVNWTASTDAVGVTGYDLQRSTDAAFTAPTTYNLGNVTTYAATGLSASTLYYWRVRAHDLAANNSAYSASGSQATSAGADATPPVIDSFTSPSQTQSSISLAWTAHD